MLSNGIILQKRYRITGQLGRGGMGAVYEAIDERLEKKIAIKEILLEVQDSADSKQDELMKLAFRREANSLVKARHAAVPDVSDYFTEEDRSYLVMEYIQGDDLSKMLKKRGKPFEFEEVLPWLNQLLEALDYLHHLNPPIIHRDIKPQNLKLNSWQQIKLLDFGIARSTDKEATLTQHTFLGATLNYSPIEQVLRVIEPTFREFIFLKHREKGEKIINQDTDARCDIFALGSTFYHLLTNKNPLDVTKRALGIWEKGVDELENPFTINPDIPMGVSSWLLQAMAFQREDRFSSAKEMQEALLALTEINANTYPPKLENQNTMQPPPTPEQRNQMQAETEVLLKWDSEKNEITKVDAPILNTNPPAIESPGDISKSQITSPEEKLSTDYKLAATELQVGEKSSNTLNERADNSAVEVDDTKEASQTGRTITIPPQIDAMLNSNLKYALALPVIGVLSLIIFGSGLLGVYYFAGDTGSGSNSNSVFETTNTTSTPQPELTPQKSEEIVTESVKTTEPTPETQKSEEQTKSTEAITKKTPEPKKRTVTKTVATPRPKPAATKKPPVKNTPKPTPKKKKLTLDDLINDN